MLKSGKRKQSKKKKNYIGPDGLYIKIDFEKSVISEILEKIQIPNGLETEDWITCKMIDFFNEINFLYANIVVSCEESCYEMSSSPSTTYLWADGEVIKDPTDVSAKEYVDYLMEFTKKKLQNEIIFPITPGVPFPEKWNEIIEVISKRLFRIFGHFFYVHYNDFCSISLNSRLHSSFSHFYLFLVTYKLISKDELESLKYLTEKIDALRDSIQSKDKKKNLNYSDDDDL